MAKLRTKTPRGLAKAKTGGVLSPQKMLKLAGAKRKGNKPFASIKNKI